MKNKGKKAWLITWEGSDAADNGRCKVVVILPPQWDDTKSIAPLLPVLFHSEYNFTLSEKMGFPRPLHKDSLFRKAYIQDDCNELWYGYFPKEYLCARKVKNLRCEESSHSTVKHTLHWTEQAKHVMNPGRYQPDGSVNVEFPTLKVVIKEQERSYTYSI